MQTFYPSSCGIQDEHKNACRVLQRSAEEPLCSQSSKAAQVVPAASLYARGAGWGRGAFRATACEKGGPRAVALDSMIRRSHSAEAIFLVLDAHMSEFDTSHAVNALNKIASLTTEHAMDNRLTASKEYLISMTSRSMSQMQPQEMVATAWSLAKLSRQDETEIWDALCNSCGSASFDAQQVANVAWSLAKVGRHDAFVWENLAVEAPRNLHTAACAEISMILWAFATHGAACSTAFPKLFRDGADLTKARIREFAPTSLANISWAFAKHVGGNDKFDAVELHPLFSILCSQCDNVVGRLSGWEVATITWACVTVQAVDTRLMTKLAAQACSSKLSVQNASTLAWAYGAAGIADEGLFQFIPQLVRGRASELDCGAASRFVWAYGSLEIPDQAFLSHLAEFLQLNTHKFTASDLSSMMTGFVRAKFIDAKLLEAVAAEALCRLSSLGALELPNLLWALASGAVCLSHKSAEVQPGSDCSAIALGRHSSTNTGMKLREFFESASNALISRADPRHVEPEALSTAVTSLRKIGLFKPALELHERLVSQMAMAAVEAGPARRERFRLQFRSREDGYPQQISYAAMFMEAERIGDVEVAVHLLESLASEARTACARACFLNVAVQSCIRANKICDARRLLSQMAGARLLNCVSHRLLHKLGLTEDDLVSIAPGERWAVHHTQMGGIEKTHSKELQLLQAVLSLRNPDPSTVLAEIEEFGLKRQWIKVAGGEKAAVVESVIAACKPCCVLEYGAYVAYTSMRMALHMRPWNGKVVSVEMDPVHVCIARNIALLTGLEEQLTVQMGHSDDAVPILHEKHVSFDMVFMDQRSTRFHSDLITLERFGMLLPGCVVVADNVLKPGAPRWLWHITRGTGYQTDIISVREFGSAETEDWMTVTFLPEPAILASVPPEPKCMPSLAAQADRMRFRTVARNMNDTRRELEDVNREFTYEFAALGIRKTKIVKTTCGGRGKMSKVVEYDATTDWIEWTSGDNRLDMQGGQWWTDVSNCEELFAATKNIGARHGVK